MEKLYEFFVFNATHIYLTLLVIVVWVVGYDVVDWAWKGLKREARRIVGFYRNEKANSDVEKRD